MLIEKTCEICGNKFTVPHWRNDTARYCSKECQNKSLHGKNNVKCYICGKEFHAKPYRLKRLTLGNVCCSKECFYKYKSIYFAGEGNHQYGLKGALNASWKGDEVKDKNNNVIDIKIFNPNHPKKDCNGRVSLHRLLVEQNHELYDDKFFDIINGNYYLKSEYHVHHKDFNHDNNDISNLQVLTQGEHTSIHNKANPRERDELGRFKSSKSI